MYPQNSDELINENQEAVEGTEIVYEQDDNILVCDGLVKIYKTDEVEVLALQGLELEIKRGELVAIIGKSGSGKSTLLNMIGGLENLPQEDSMLTAPIFMQCPKKDL